jgi:hypothetical protein
MYVGEILAGAARADARRDWVGAIDSGERKRCTAVNTRAGGQVGSDVFRVSAGAARRARVCC